MKIKSSIYSMFILVLFASCGTKKQSQTSSNNEPVVETTTENEPREVYPQAEIGKIGPQLDPIKINSVVIERNYMILDVTYSGGCETHDFKLIGSNITAKSIPPIRSVQLFHDGKGDKCKKLVSEKIKFSISVLAENYEVGNLIQLQIEDYESTLSYSYD